MAGLDPAIHVKRKDVDPRVKPGDDDLGSGRPTKYTVLTDEEFGNGFCRDRVRQNDRHVERFERGAVAFGETDAIEQDRLGAADLQLRSSAPKRCLGVAAVGARRTENRWGWQGAPFAALGADLRDGRHGDAELAPLD